MTTTEGIEHDVQLLDRVTIRFAGDSGDGMQLTGTQFTRTAAVFGNDISTFPDYPAEIRAPAGSLPGVSGFQISFSASDIHTPGDAPDVLVAMNPAALKTNVMDLPAGGADHRQRRCLHARQPGQGGVRRQPAGGRLAQAVQGLRGPDLHPQRERARGAGHDQQAGGPDEELLRAGPDVLALRAVDGADDRLDRGEVRGPPGHRRGQPPGPLRGLRLRRDHRDVPHDLPGAEGEAATRAPTGTSPATRRPPWASSPPQRPRSATCSTAPTRSRRPRTSSSSSPATSRSAFGPSRPRTRSPRWARRSVRPTAAPSP